RWITAFRESWHRWRNRSRMPVFRYFRSRPTTRITSWSRSSIWKRPSMRLPVMDTPSASDLPKLYGELASWFHLLSSPPDYSEEAEFARKLIVEGGSTEPRFVLELGSGGGNNASHLKAHFKMTLVDLSPGMLELSRQLNPECEHIQGDMKSIRLGRMFDAVFIHDAIMYMRNENDLRLALETASIHCKSG